MTTTKQYDNLDRLTSISSAVSGQPAIAFGYGYNMANERTNRTDWDGTHWAFGYDPLGQVTNGTKYWADNSPVPGEQFGYAFDDIGNRTGSTSGTNSNGTPRSAAYSANKLNQYTNRTVPNGLDIIGIANAQATVTVNSASVDYRRGEFFKKGLTEDNSGGAVWLTTTAAVSGSSSSVTGNLFVPPASENYAYDDDGNLLSDGRFLYTWDAENRLINITSLSNSPSGSEVKVDNVYDSFGRRIQKTVYTKSGTNWVSPLVRRFVYDGWNLIAVLDGNNDNALLCSYTWGADLSGTVQGAGGVGGWTSMTIPTGQPNAGTYCPCYDGNGNVMALVNAANGTVVAQYEYDAFGNLLQATGPLAQANNILFSTKFLDWETGLYYYGYRYYNPSTGRWLSRDPIEEAGGANLYGFVQNNPANHVDPLGLESIEELQMMIKALDEAMKAAPMGSPEWIEAQVTKNRLYGLLRNELAIRAGLRGLCRNGSALAVGVGLGVVIGNITPSEGGGTINQAVEDNFVGFWNWWYRVDSDGGHYEPRYPSASSVSIPVNNQMMMF